MEFSLLHPTSFILHPFLVVSSSWRATLMSLPEFFSRYGNEILDLSLEHLFLVCLSTGTAILLGVPMGILITFKPLLRKPILGFANIVQTIPSLALFGFLIPVPFLGGIGARTAIIALILYGLLPIIRNTYTGVSGIDPLIRESALALGMRGRDILFQIEIPLSLSVILAGIRVASVTSVGVATIAAAIGAGGLGVFIFRGVAMVDNSLILAGAIPAALIAISADFILGWLEKHFSPVPRGKR